MFITAIATAMAETATAIAPMAMIGGGVVGGVGAYMQGQAADDAAKAQEKIYAQQAAIKEAEALKEQELAREKADQFMTKGEQLLSKQKTLYAKGGVLLSGTPSLVIDNTYQNLQEDKRRILEEGYLLSEQKMNEAYGLKMQGAAARARGKNAKSASYWGMAGSILTGIGGYGMAANSSSTVSSKFSSMASKADKWLNTMPTW